MRVLTPPKAPDLDRDFAAALDDFHAEVVEWPDIPVVVAALPAVSAAVKLLAVVAGVDFPDDELLQRGVGAVAGGAWTAAHPSSCCHEFRKKPMHVRERGGGIGPGGLAIGP